MDIRKKHITFTIPNKELIGKKNNDSIEIYNRLFNRSKRLSQASINLCITFAFLLILYSIIIYKTSNSIKVIEQNNSLIVKVLTGEEKLWYDYKNYKIYLKSRKK